MAVIRIKRGLQENAPTSSLNVGELYFFVDNGAEKFAIAKSSSQYVIFEPGNLFLKKASNLSDVANAGTARTNLDVYSKSEVESMIVGMTWKEVDVATTANITLEGQQTIDGVALTNGDTVLVKNQSVKSENGVYVVAVGAWARADFADEPAELENIACIIQEGSENGNTVWICTSKNITIGTTDIEFVQLPGAAAINAGEGLSKTGNTLLLNLLGLSTTTTPDSDDYIPIVVGSDQKRIKVSDLLGDIATALYKVAANATDDDPGVLNQKLLAGTGIAITFPTGVQDNANKAVFTLTMAGVDDATNINAEADELYIRQSATMKKHTLNTIVNAATIDGGTF